MPDPLASSPPLRSSAVRVRVVEVATLERARALLVLARAALRPDSIGRVDPYTARTALRLVSSELTAVVAGEDPNAHAGEELLAATRRP